MDAFYKWFTTAMLGTGLMVAGFAVFMQIKGAPGLACSALLWLRASSPGLAQ